MSNRTEDQHAGFESHDDQHNIGRADPDPDPDSEAERIRSLTAIGVPADFAARTSPDVVVPKVAPAKPAESARPRPAEGSRVGLWEELERVSAALAGLLALLAAYSERIAECHEAYCLLEPLKARLDRALHVLCMDD